MVKFDAKKGQKYIVLIVNWGDTKVNSDFNISTFSDTKTAELTK